jgi:hypothetical protein
MAWNSLYDQIAEVSCKESVLASGSRLVDIAELQDHTHPENGGNLAHCNKFLPPLTVWVVGVFDGSGD